MLRSDKQWLAVTIVVCVLVFVACRFWRWYAPYGSCYNRTVVIVHDGREVEVKADRIVDHNGSVILYGVNAHGRSYDVLYVLSGRVYVRGLE